MEGVDDHTFLTLMHGDPKVPVRLLSESVKRGLAEVLDVPTSTEGDYRHVAQLLGYLADQQLWIKSLNANLGSPTLNMLAVLEGDKPTYTVQELVSVFQQLQHRTAIRVIKASWTEIQRLNGSFVDSRARPNHSVPRQRPVEHTEPCYSGCHTPVQHIDTHSSVSTSSTMGFQSRGAAVHPRTMMPAVQPRDTSDILLEPNVSSWPEQRGIYPEKYDTEVLYKHREGAVNIQFPGQHHRRTNNEAQHAEAAVNPQFPGQHPRGQVQQQRGPTTPQQLHGTSMQFQQQRSLEQQIGPTTPDQLHRGQMNYMQQQQQLQQHRAATNIQHHQTTSSFPPQQHLANPTFSVPQQAESEPMDVKPNLSDLQIGPAGPHESELTAIKELYAKEEPEETIPKVPVTPDMTVDSKGFNTERVIEVNVPATSQGSYMPMNATPIGMSPPPMDLNLQGPDTMRMHEARNQAENGARSLQGSGARSHQGNNARSHLRNDARTRQGNDAGSFPENGVGNLGNGAKSIPESNRPLPFASNYSNDEFPALYPKFPPHMQLPPTNSINSTGNFNFGRSYDEQKTPYDLSLSENHGQQARVKEEPMEYAENGESVYSMQQRQQQQQQPIDYTQRMPPPVNLNVHVHVHQNGHAEATTSGNGHDGTRAKVRCEEEIRNFNRQSSHRLSYPPLVVSPGESRPSSTSSTSSKSAKEPMQRVDHVKGKRCDVRVLITYSHDSDRHVKLVLQLAKWVRNNGFTVKMDEDGPDVTDDQFFKYYDQADVILICLSPLYHRRVERDAPAENEKDAKLHTVRVFEKIRNEFWKGPPGRKKKMIIPIFFPTAAVTHLPQWMVNLPNYHWPDDWRNLMFYISRPDRLVERQRNKTVQEYHV